MDDTGRSPPALRQAIVVGGDDALADAIGAALSSQGAAVGRALAGPPAELDVLVIVAPEERLFSFAATSADAFCDAVGGALKSAFLDLQRGVAAIRAGGAGGSVVVVAPASAAHRSFDALQQGLRLMVKAAALELGPEGVRVNIVLPGAGATPLGRPCAPVDIAAAVAFVASDRARFMTGADLVVDGGRLAL